MRDERDSERRDSGDRTGRAVSCAASRSPEERSRSLRRAGIERDARPGATSGGCGTTRASVRPSGGRSERRGRRRRYARAARGTPCGGQAVLWSPASVLGRRRASSRHPALHRTPMPPGSAQAIRAAAVWSLDAAPEAGPRSFRRRQPPARRRADRARQPRRSPLAAPTFAVVSSRREGPGCGMTEGAAGSASGRRCERSRRRLAAPVRRPEEPRSRTAVLDDSR